MEEHTILKVSTVKRLIKNSIRWEQGKSNQVNNNEMKAKVFKFLTA